MLLSANNRMPEIIICKIVITTDKVCNKTKLFLFFASDALLMAGMRNILAGTVVMKILKAKPTVILLVFIPNKIIRADTTST